MVVYHIRIDHRASSEFVTEFEIISGSLIQSESVLVCPPLSIQWNLLFRKNLRYKDDPQWEYLVVIHR